MKSFTNEEIYAYIKKEGWNGSYPMFNEFKEHWKGKTLEEGYTSFKASRDSMFNSIKSEFQSSHSAMSKRGADAYANNWN